LLESGGYALPIPHDVLMTLGYCKSAANPEIEGNPQIPAFSLYQRGKCAENRSPKDKSLPKRKIFFHFAVYPLRKTPRAAHPRSVSSHVSARTHAQRDR